MSQPPVYVEPIGGLVRPIDVEHSPEESSDEYAEDLLAASDGVRLPDWFEEHMAKEREWWRLVRELCADETPRRGGRSPRLGHRPCRFEDPGESV